MTGHLAWEQLSQSGLCLWSWSQAPQISWIFEVTAGFGIFTSADIFVCHVNRTHEWNGVTHTHSHTHTHTHIQGLSQGRDQLDGGTDGGFFGCREGYIHQCFQGTLSHSHTHTHTHTHTD